MSKPQHPDTIIVKNIYYPNGLTEKNVWDHYQKYKKSILSQCIDREIFLLLIIDGKIVVRRSIKSNYIKLDNSNYDYIISGRSISLIATMNKNENFAVIDIDSDNFSEAKEATIDCYKVLDKFPIVKDIKVRYTGKKSFHLVCKLKKYMNIDSIRFLFTKYMTSSTLLTTKYTFAKKRTNVPNIDLFRNTFRGGFIMLNALSTVGLQCMEIDINNIVNFSKYQAIID